MFALLAMTLAQDAFRSTPYGDLALMKFDSAPYPHASRENGFKGSQKTYPRDPHYVDSTVGVFIPSGVKLGAHVNFVVHFHGHNNHVEQVFTQFELAREMKESGLNAVLLVPQGPRDAADSGDGKLQFEPHALENLLNEALAQLRGAGRAPSKSDIGKVALTAHSGGYLVTSSILGRNELPTHITDVILFDASYGGLEAIADWTAADRKRRLISICTDHLGHENLRLAGLMQKRGLTPRIVKEEELTDADVAKRGALFVPTTTLEHNDVVAKRNYFAKWLASSRG